MTIKPQKHILYPQGLLNSPDSEHSPGFSQSCLTLVLTMALRLAVIIDREPALYPRPG